MKRLRIIGMDFDSRADTLALKIEDYWEESVKAFHHTEKRAIREEILHEFGVDDDEQKLRNFQDLGAPPVSIVAFHNKLYLQARRAFVIGSYYPALTAACALGERILNHLILLLRDDFRSTPEYKRVYRKESFDDWELPLVTLTSWNVLLPAATEAFRALKEERNRAIHFRPQTEQDDRPLALSALQSLAKIIQEQFGSFGTQQWFIPDTRGEWFIAKAAESQPFVCRVYRPNCALVGPHHRIEFHGNRMLILDEEYPDCELTDEEFLERRKAFLPR